MKKLIILITVLAVSLIGYGQTNYYVSNDGDDGNTGLSDAQAWETISQVNGESFSAGDTIFFNKGDIWREKLVPPSSGSAGTPIVFSAYGTGDDPIISGSEVTTGWTLDNIVVAAVSADLAEETFDGTGYDLGAAWDESYGSGSVIDEDNTDIVDENGASSNILKIQKVSPNTNARLRWRSASAPAVSYLQVYINVTAESFEAFDWAVVVKTQDASFNTPYVIRLLKEGNSLHYRLVMYNNGALEYTTAVTTTALGEWTKMEMKWDLTGGTYEWRINDLIELSGSLSGTLYGNPRDFRLGDDESAVEMTGYYNNFKISSTGWPSPALDFNVYRKLNESYAAFDATHPTVVFESDVQLSENVRSKEELRVGEFYYGNDSVYVRTTGDDNISGYIMELGYRDRAVDSGTRNYITYENLVLRDGNSPYTGIRFSASGNLTEVSFKSCVIERNAGDGFTVQSASGADFLIDNCTIRHNGKNGISVVTSVAAATYSNNEISYNGTRSREGLFEDQISGIQGDIGNTLVFGNEIHHNAIDGHDGGSHGIYIGTGTEVAYIYNNEIYNNEHDGIKAKGNSVIYNNISYNNGQAGISCGQNAATNPTYNVYYNIVYNNEYNGIREITKGTGDIYLHLYNNTIYNNYLAQINIADDTDSITIKNNIVYARNAADGIYAVNFDVAQTGVVTIDNNIYYNPSDVVTFDISAGDIAFAAWQSAGYDASGDEANPLLTSPTTDFSLQSTSPALNAGVNVGLTEDYYGTTVGSTPDMGAIEYYLDRKFLVSNGKLMY